MTITPLIGFFGKIPILIRDDDTNYIIYITLDSIILSIFFLIINLILNI
jgi:hypothetical protein